MQSNALVVGLVGLFALVGCSSSVSSPSVSPTKPSRGAYVVGGEVSGLRGIGLTLKNGRGQEAHIKSDGAFIFNESVEDKSDYVVTIEREPIAPVQSCSLENAMGRVAGRDVMTITVRCTTSSFEPAPSSAPATSSVALLEAVR